jgi:hypothetical protein
MVVLQGVFAFWAFLSFLGAISLAKDDISPPLVSILKFGLMMTTVGLLIVGALLA